MDFKVYTLKDFTPEQIKALEEMRKVGHHIWCSQKIGSIPGNASFCDKDCPFGHKKGPALIGQCRCRVMANESDEKRNLPMDAKVYRMYDRIDRENQRKNIELVEKL